MNLKDIRKDLDLTQQKLADMLGVDIRTVRRWENGEIKMPKTAELLVLTIEKNTSVIKMIDVGGVIFKLKSPIDTK